MSSCKDSKRGSSFYSHGRFEFDSKLTSTYPLLARIIAAFMPLFKAIWGKFILVRTGSNDFGVISTTASDQFSRRETNETSHSQQTNDHLELYLAHG